MNGAEDSESLAQHTLATSAFLHCIMESQGNTGVEDSSVNGQMTTSQELHSSDTLGRKVSLDMNVGCGGLSSSFDAAHATGILDDKEDPLQQQLKISSGLKRLTLYQNLRSQFSDQLRSLETRLESQVALVSEISDFFRRRSETEAEIARLMERNILKGVRRGPYLQQQHQQGSASWAPPLLTSVRAILLSDTSREVQEHQVMSEICSLIASKLTTIADELRTVFRQVHTNTIPTLHSTLQRSLQDLYATSKAFTSLNGEWVAATSKLRASEQKLEQKSNQFENQGSGFFGVGKGDKGVKRAQNEVQKRQSKSAEAHLKCLQARNSYVLSLEATNGAIRKYFVEDCSDLLDLLDLGFYECLRTILSLYTQAMEICRDPKTVEPVSRTILNLDARLDKQKFLEAHNSAFVLPRKIDFADMLAQSNGEDPVPIGGSGELDGEAGQNGDLSTTALYPQLTADLVSRLESLAQLQSSLQLESSETWKTLENLELSLLSAIEEENWKKAAVREWFAVGAIRDEKLLGEKSAGELKKKSSTGKSETVRGFHVEKFSTYLNTTSRVARLSAKTMLIQRALGRNVDHSPAIERASAHYHRKRLIGHRFPSAKLFGGSIEEYLAANPDLQIPPVLKSCVRVVKRFGFLHQGIFRVSGSQVEINNFRDAFERGEDPLRELTDASDINSVAGLLKLYLRELREPLFPIVYFEIFMEIAKIQEPTLFVTRMRDLVAKSFPRSVFVVLRYLFHFLNHLSQYSTQNMMDPWNLAICFGPTLVPTLSEEKEQLVHCQNLVNELIKNLIEYAQQVFPNDSDSEVYDMSETAACFAPPAKSCGSEKTDGSVVVVTSKNGGSGISHKAIGLHDFQARSAKELSFRKGEELILSERVSQDWWKGWKVKGGWEQGKMWLIPDRYVKLKVDVEGGTGDDDSGQMSKGSKGSGGGSTTHSTNSKERKQHQRDGRELSTNKGNCDKDRDSIGVPPMVPPLPSDLIVEEEYEGLSELDGEDGVNDNDNDTTSSSSSSSAFSTSTIKKQPEKPNSATYYTPDLVLDLPSMTTSSPSVVGASERIMEHSHAAPPGHVSDSSDDEDSKSFLVASMFASDVTMTLKKNNTTSRRDDEDEEDKKTD